LSARLKTAEESAKIFVDVKSKQDAQASAEEWRKHRQDVLNFAVEKIEQLPNASKLLELVKPSDVEIIAKYDKQRQELFDKGVAASLMTPEEKQMYYDASSRKNDFLNFLRDQYGIEEDASEEIYKELITRSKNKAAEAKTSQKETARAENEGAIKDQEKN